MGLIFIFLNIFEFNMASQTEQKIKQDTKVQKPQEKLNITSSKKQYEILWRVLFVFITIVSAILGKKIYLFQTMPQFDEVRKGLISDFLIYGIPFSIIFTMFDYGWHYLLDQFVEDHVITLKRYTDPKSKKKRSYTLVKWSYSVIYYVLTSFFGVYLLKDTSYWPQYLGGHGSSFSLAQERHLREATLGMKIYYIIQFGKHFSRFFSHVFIKPEGNYYEYVLHHSLSTFLIIFSYTMNMWLIGIFVLIVHDYTDFGLILARAYKDYRYRRQWLLTIFYIHATGSWFLLRIFIFNYSCVYAPWYQVMIEAPGLMSALQMQVMHFAYMFMCFMLTGLQVMHIFWTYYILASFIEVNVSEKIANHSYD